MEYVRNNMKSVENVLQPQRKSETFNLVRGGECHNSLICLLLFDVRRNDRSTGGDGQERKVLQIV